MTRRRFVRNGALFIPAVPALAQLFPFPGPGGKGAGGGGGFSGPYTDDFNRASLGGNWTVGFAGRTFSIDSSTHLKADTFSHGSVYYNAVTWPNNQTSSVTLGPITSAGNYIGPAVRINGADDWYTFIIDSAGSWFLGSVIDGTYDTNIANGSGVTLVEGDILTLDITGTTLTAKLNGTPISGATGTNSQIASGSAGVAALNGPYLVNAWSGNSL